MAVQIYNNTVQVILVLCTHTPSAFTTNDQICALICIVPDRNYYDAHSQFLELAHV